MNRKTWSVSLAAGALLLLAGYLLLSISGRSGSESVGAVVSAAGDSKPSAIIEPFELPEQRRQLEVEDAPSLEVKSIAASGLVDIEVVNALSFEVVPQARVSLFLGGSLRDLGVTDQQGRLEGQDVSSMQGGVVSAILDGFYSHKVVLGGDEDSPIMVSVSPATAIRGTVVLADGGVPYGGATVIAWESAARFPPRDAFLRACAGDPDYHLAVSLADGSFSIEGVLGSRHYSLAAGALGYSVSSPSLLIVPDDGPVELLIQPVYACRISLIGPSGEALESPVHVPLSAEVTIAPIDHDLQGSSIPEWMMGLAGVQDDFSKSNRWENGIAFTSLRDMASLGPFRITGTLDGYTPFEHTFFLPRVTTDQVPNERIRLERDGRDMGAFSIKITGGSSGDPWFLNRIGEAGRVFLDNEGAHLLYTFPRFSQGLVEVGEVPAGIYEVHFGSQYRDSYFPTDSPNALRLRIGKDPAFATLDISHLCELSIALVDPQGVNYLGPLVAYISSGRSLESGGSGLSGTFEAGFSQGPYVIPGLTPGEYTVSTRFPRMLRSGVGESIYVGDDSSAELVIGISE